MMLLCLANTGSSLANTFRFMYARICCGYCNYVKRRQVRLKALSAINGHGLVSGLSLIKKGSLNSTANENKDSSQKDEKDILQSKMSTSMNENNLIDIYESTKMSDYRKITVPISVTLFILSSYIVLGAWLFSVWEGWTYLDGAYFCFITLSTIGLGDFVPGNSIKDTQAEEKLVLCSVYLFMGMSLIAMCFDLMQEEVTAKFRRLAIRLGIIDDPDYW